MILLDSRFFIEYNKVMLKRDLAKSILTWGLFIFAVSGFSLLAFVIINPILNVNASIVSATDAGVVYSASISVEDSVDRIITSTAEQIAHSFTSAISYTNTCPYGFNLYFSSESDETDLVRSDGVEKTVPTIEVGPALSDNTWGYSLDHGINYKPIPTLSSPDMVLDIVGANFDPQNFYLQYGIMLDRRVIPGEYSRGVVYSIAAKPACFTYGISWDGGDGTNPEGLPTELNLGMPTDLSVLPRPTRNYYEFAGWSNGETDFTGNETDAQINPSYIPAITMTALWNPVPYAISYNLNGGVLSAANPTSYNTETNSFALSNPTKNGYTFVGWTGSNGSTPQTSVTIPKGSGGDKAYTANWTPTPYTISYNLGGGSASNPTSYNIETDTFALNAPTRASYRFTGWTGSNGSTPQIAVTIPKGSTGNRTYAANWVLSSYAATVSTYGASRSCSSYCNCPHGNFNGPGHCRYDESQGISVSWGESCGPYTCNSGDSLSGSTCYHYSCPSGGTLSGTMCVL